MVMIIKQPARRLKPPRRKKEAKSRKEEEANFVFASCMHIKGLSASCVDHFSQLNQHFANLTVLIKDQWVENNISKIQLNPTVNEVTMAVLLKGVGAVKIELHFGCSPLER